jgi:hypothetical protein
MLAEAVHNGECCAARMPTRLGHQRLTEMSGVVVVANGGRWCWEHPQPVGLAALFAGSPAQVDVDPVGVRVTCGSRHACSTESAPASGPTRCRS